MILKHSISIDLVSSEIYRFELCSFIILAPSERIPLSSSVKPKNFFFVSSIYAALFINLILFSGYFLIMFFWIKFFKFGFGSTKIYS